MYPVPSTVIYTGKLLFNFVTIGLIAGVLIPLFAILCDTQLLRHPIAILVVTLIAAWGLAAAGTFIGALCAWTQRPGRLARTIITALGPTRGSCGCWRRDAAAVGRRNRLRVLAVVATAGSVRRDVYHGRNHGLPIRYRGLTL